MRKAKTKSSTFRAAQSREEAERLVARIGELQRELTRREADLGDMVAKVKAEAEKAAQPLREELTRAHDAVHAWAEVNRSELTRGGKVKTVDVATGRLTWRNRPPSVRLRKVDDVLAYLLANPGLDRFVRTKHEVNKEALGDEPDAARAIPGVSISSGGEDFAVEPFEAPLVASTTGAAA